MVAREGSGALVGLAAVAAMLAGAAGAVQSRLNAGLATALGASPEAAWWSFASGWVVLAAGLVVLPRARRGLAEVARAVRAQHLQWWEVLGGMFGCFFVAVQTYAVPTMGVALFTIAIVGGQTASSLAVDRFGLGPAGRTPPTLGRVVAALTTFAGVAVATSARGGGGGHGLTVLALVLTIAAGAGMAVQQAINGKVNVASRDVVATTFVNFTWGTLALTLWLAVLAVRGGLPVPRLGAVPWWTLLGGVIGIVFIATTAATVRVLGVLVSALMTLTGQLVTAVALDVLAPSGHRTSVSAQLVLGVAITLAAAVGAGLAARRRAPSPGRRPAGPSVEG